MLYHIRPSFDLTSTGQTLFPPQIYRCHRCACRRQNWRARRSWPRCRHRDRCTGCDGCRCRRWHRNGGRLQEAQIRQSFHVEITLRLHNARIQPKQSMPAEALVQLLRFGTLTRARRAQRRAQNTEHCRAAHARTAGAFQRHTVDGARLLVVFEPGSALGVLLAKLGDYVARRQRRVQRTAGRRRRCGRCGAGAHIGRPLRANGMELLLRAHADVRSFGGFLAQTEGDVQTEGLVGAAIERFQGVHAGVAIAAPQVAMLQHRLHGTRTGLILAARLQSGVTGALCERRVRNDEWASQWRKREMGTNHWPTELYELRCGGAKKDIK